MSLGPGDQLGDYRIVSRLGAGAYGEVFEAEHVITRRRDAIKVLFDSRLRIPEEEERFLREIRVQASLHHPNIAAVYHAFWTPHGLALVMELAPGEALSTLLSRGRIPLADGVRLMLEVLVGLGYAHGQSVVHRDIKPENIIVAPEGSVKLTDFGLARSPASPRLTQTGAAAGSPCYMAPEQALGTTMVDSRSDTYSAGVVLYEIATGQLPFVGETAFAVMLAHRNTEPTPPIDLSPAIGPELNQVILRALEKDPDQRFQNAEEFHAALASVVTPPQPVVAPPEPAPARPMRLLAAAGVCSLAIIAAAYSVTHRSHRPEVVVHQPTVEVLPGLAERPNPVAPPETQAEDPVPDADPEPPPRAPVVKTAKRVNAPPPIQPLPEKVQISGSSADTSAASASALARRADRPVDKRSTALVISSAPTVDAPMPVPETKSAPAPTEDEPKAAPVKRRNVMVRAFQHVFGRKPATTPAPSDTPAQPAVPRH